MLCPLTAKLLSELQHPNVAALQGSGMYGGRFAVFLENAGVKLPEHFAEQRSVPTANQVAHELLSGQAV